MYQAFNTFFHLNKDSKVCDIGYFAFHSGTHRIFFNGLLPGIGLFRAPGRWLALFALGGAMLAGMGLEQLRSQTGPALARLRAGVELKDGLTAPAGAVRRRVQRVPSQA